MFDGSEYVFDMINKGQIHAGIISIEIQLNIILSNALPLCLSSLIRLSFETLVNEYVNIALFALYIYETEV